MIDKFLADQQDFKIVEKIYERLNDLLTTGEEIIYIAVQKKPVVNLLADCIALTNKRIIFFTPANFGLSMKVVDFVWKDVVDVQFREEILGAIFMAKTTDGAEISVDYLPKVQARKLYQYAQERKEAEREARRQRDLESKRAESGSFIIDNPVKAAYQAQVPAPQPVHPPIVVNNPEPVSRPVPPVLAAEPARPAEAKPDELTEKLKKLKTLFDQELISKDDYDRKRTELLNDF